MELWYIVNRYYIILKLYVFMQVHHHPSSHTSSNSMHVSSMYYYRLPDTLASSYSGVATAIPAVKQKVACSSARMYTITVT